MKKRPPLISGGRSYFRINQQPVPHSRLRICQIEQQLDPQKELQSKKNILLTS